MKKHITTAILAATLLFTAQPIRPSCDLHRRTNRALGARLNPKHSQSRPYQRLPGRHVSPECARHTCASRQNRRTRHRRQAVRDIQTAIPRCHSGTRRL